jgi:anti-sigma factor ChrR (cupin superfamily)
MFSPPHFDPHFEVAAYALGVLDPADSEAFEAHLVDCMECQAELLELHEVPAALDLIKGGPAAVSAAPAAPRRGGEAAVASLLDRVAARRRKRTRGLWLAVAAAVTITAVTPVAVRQFWPEPGESSVAAQTFRAASAEKNVQASIALVPQPWGTEVSFELTGVTGPLQCTLVAVSRTGETETVASWKVKAGQGFGVAGHEEPLRLKGATSFDKGDIKRFEFRTNNGPDLLDVPAS